MSMQNKLTEITNFNSSPTHAQHTAAHRTAAYTQSINFAWRIENSIHAYGVLHLCFLFFFFFNLDM